MFGIQWRWDLQSEVCEMFGGAAIWVHSEREPRCDEIECFCRWFIAAAKILPLNVYRCTGCFGECEVLLRCPLVDSHISVGPKPKLCGVWNPPRFLWVG